MSTKHRKQQSFICNTNNLITMYTNHSAKMPSTHPTQENSFGFVSALKSILILAMVLFSFSTDIHAQCTNMVMSNGTPIWNGNEYCTGYNPNAINAPIINYTGSCSFTPAYSYKWEQSIDGGSWTVISQNAAGTRVSTVPGYNPPAFNCCR
jgi:hypothetical protein